jgi:hypothetical protein
MQKNNLSNSDLSLNLNPTEQQTSTPAPTATTKRTNLLDSNNNSNNSHNLKSNISFQTTAAPLDESNDDSLQLDEDDHQQPDEAADIATDDSEIDYDRKLLRQQLRYQERVETQQLQQLQQQQQQQKQQLIQKDLELESLKNLLKNLELLDSKNQLESLLLSSPSRLLNQKQKSSSLSNQQHKQQRAATNTNKTMSDLYSKLESFDLVKAASNIVLDGGDYNHHHHPHNNQNMTTTTTTTSSGGENNPNDPVRVIKITEIIEINNNNSNGGQGSSTNLNLLKTPQKSTPQHHHHHHLTTYTLSNNSSNEPPPPPQLPPPIFYHVTKTNESQQTTLPSSEYRQLPILIERLAHETTEKLEQKAATSLAANTTTTTMTNTSTSGNNESGNSGGGGQRNNVLSKNAEIVLEIINILNGGGVGSRSNSPTEFVTTDPANNLNLMFSGKGANYASDYATGQSGSARPKKITIRITGRTRSVSSDNKLKEGPAVDASTSQLNSYSGDSVRACVREPIVIEDITAAAAEPQQGVAKSGQNASSYGEDGVKFMSPLNTFKPILDCRVAEAESPLTQTASNRKEEDEIKSDLNEIKFNLEKFKSYLTTLSESANNNFAFATLDTVNNNNGNNNNNVQQQNNGGLSSQKSSNGGAGGNFSTNVSSSMHTIVNR